MDWVRDPDILARAAVTNSNFPSPRTGAMDALAQGVYERASNPLQSLLDALSQAYGYGGTKEMQQAFRQVPAALPEGLPVGMGGFPVMLGTFGGAKAATADLGLLQIAMDAEKKGLSKERIMDATGWFKGADDKWRFEIDDSGMNAFISNLQDTAHRYDPIIRQVEDAQRIRKIMGDRGVTATDAARVAKDAGVNLQQGAIDLARRSDDKYLASTLAEVKRKREIAPKEGFVDEVIEGGGVLEAYPKMGNYSVSYGELGGGLRGEFRGSGVSLDSSKLKAIPERTGVMAHELQHGIQDIEDFARGGSPGEFRAFREKQNGLMKAVNTIDKAVGFDKWLVGNKDRLLKELKRTRENGGNPIDNLRIDYANEQLSGATRVTYIDKLRQARQIEEENKSLFGGIDPRRLSDYEGYRSLAGETEARNVQTRLPLSADDRRMLYPWLTEDVPGQDQIVRFR